MSVESHLRDELASEAARVPVGSGDLDRVIRRGRHRARNQMAAAVAGSIAILAIPMIALQWPAPDAGPVGSVTSLPESGTTTVDEGPVTTFPATTVPAETVPADAAGSRVVVAGPEGVAVIQDGALVEHFDLGPVMLAVDDTRGGIVFQIGVSASSILWLERDSSEPIELIAADPGIVLSLHEVVEIDGSPAVVYTSRTTGLAPEETREDLRIRDLDDGTDTLVGQTGGYESSATRISYAAGRWVTSMSAEGYTWFEELGGDTAGFHNPRTEDDAAENFLVWVGHAVQAPDGATMAFMRGSPRSEAPFQLVVVDLATGAELMAVPVEGSHETTLTRVDWDGETAVVSLSQQPAVVVRDGAVVEQLPAVGIADLAS